MNEILSNYTNVSNAFLNNSTNDTLSSLEESLPVKVSKTTAYCLLFLVSLTGNALIIWAIYRDTRLRTNTNILVANMAVSDLLCTLVIAPFRIVNGMIFDGRWLIDGNFGLALCKLVYFLENTPFVVSVYSCIFIAVDRYYAVAHPFRGGFSRSRLKYIIPGIWIFAALVCSALLYGGALLKNGDLIYCYMDWSQAGIPNTLGDKIAFLSMIVLANAIPFTVITFLYSLIVYRLRKHKTPGRSLESVRKRRRIQKEKILKMSVIIIGFLFFSWIFYDFYFVLLLFGKLGHLSSSIQHDLIFAVDFILNLSLTYNFFIYLIFNDIYRKNFKTVVSRCLRIQSRMPTKRYQSTMTVTSRLSFDAAGNASKIDVELVNMKINNREIK